MPPHVVPGESARALQLPATLNSARIGVMPRVGWALRAARTTSAGHPGLEEMARRVESNTTRIHRLETGLIRSGDLLEAYERALGLVAGSLRATIDMSCRRFADALIDREGVSHVQSVHELSQLTELLMSAEPVGGYVWMQWSRALTVPGAIGLPESIAIKLIFRLIDEMDRAHGPGLPTRYEALALLRCSDYGHLVLLAAQHLVADSDIRLLKYTMPAVGERLTPDAISWCLMLLNDPRESIVESAAVALENLGTSPAAYGMWQKITAELITTHNAHAPEAPGWAWRSHAVRLVPDSVMREHRQRLRTPLAPTPAADDWHPKPTNAHWMMCVNAAGEMCAALGLSGQLTLARLMFEVAVGHYEGRAMASYLLIACVPALGDLAVKSFGSLVQMPADPCLHAQIERRLIDLSRGRIPPISGSPFSVT